MSSNINDVKPADPKKTLRDVIEAKIDHIILSEYRMMVLKRFHSLDDIENSTYSELNNAFKDIWGEMEKVIPKEKQTKETMFEMISSYLSNRQYMLTWLLNASVVSYLARIKKSQKERELKSLNNYTKNARKLIVGRFEEMRRQELLENKHG